VLGKKFFARKKVFSQNKICRDVALGRLISTLYKARTGAAKFSAAGSLCFAPARYLDTCRSI
jgi:hypothetical protein